MSDDPTTGLLAAEEAATQLLSDLATLRAQVKHYDAAGQSLDEARESVTALVGRLSEVAEKLSLVATAIGSIGAPQIIASVERTSEASLSAITATSTNLDTWHSRTDAAVKQLEKGQETQAARLDSRLRGVRGLVVVVLLISLLAFGSAGAVLYLLLTGASSV